MKFEPQFKKTSQMFSRKTLSVCGFGISRAVLKPLTGEKVPFQFSIPFPRNLSCVSTRPAYPSKRGTHIAARV